MEPSRHSGHETELRAVVDLYARRPQDDRYSIFRPEVILSGQEWQREMLRLLSGPVGLSSADLPRLRVVDVGCGHGGRLLDFLRYGFRPANLVGLELLPDRVAYARSQLPAAVKIYDGDASVADIEPGSQDIVFQSVVFSSLLSDEFQQELAARMWSWLRPGGGIIWYDFIYDNPGNPDVRAVPLKRVRALFPEAQMTVRRVTLAPPISRRVCRIHPMLYHVFNAIPALRTHLLCWIAKRS